jgi:hypothetical protein
MSFLQSSIFGQEFVNYRKSNAHYQRTKFSSNVRQKGIGTIPIVIDSVNEELSKLLGGPDTRYRNYGKEYIMNMDTTVLEFINQVNIDIDNLSPEFLNGKKLSFGLENGSFIDTKISLGYIYKKHKNDKDDILYILLTTETTIYGYIMSILRYLKIW